jgi:hypothetical protein
MCDYALAGNVTVWRVRVKAETRHVLRSHVRAADIVEKPPTRVMNVAFSALLKAIAEPVQRGARIVSTRTDLDDAILVRHLFLAFSVICSAVRCRVFCSVQLLTLK